MSLRKGMLFPLKESPPGRLQAHSCFALHIPFSLFYDVKACNLFTAAYTPYGILISLSKSIILLVGLWYLNGKMNMMAVAQIIDSDTFHHLSAYLFYCHQMLYYLY